MPSKEQILEYLSRQSAPVSLDDILPNVGGLKKNLKTQVKRLREEGKIMGSDEALSLVPSPSVAESVADEALEDTPETEAPPQEQGNQEEQQPPATTHVATTQVREAMTPRDVFRGIGERIGINKQRLDLCVDYVWTGNYEDVDFVYSALRGDMEIRQDLARIWAKSWASHLQVPIPGHLLTAWQKQRAAEEQGRKLPGKASPGLEASTGNERDLESISWDIDPNTNLVQYCGYNLGVYNHSDAVQISKIRASRLATTPVAGQNNNNPIDQATQTINLMKGLREIFEKPGAENKSYIVRPGEDGQLAVQEMEPGGAPVVVHEKPAPNSQPPSVFFLDPEDNQIKQQPANQPIVLQPRRQEQAQSPVYLVDSRTGEIQTRQPGEPMIIKVESPREESGFSKSPIQMPDGTVMNLGDYLLLDKHNREQKREDDGYKNRMEMMGTFRQFLGNLSLAATRMAGQRSQEGAQK